MSKYVQEEKAKILRQHYLFQKISKYCCTLFECQSGINIFIELLIYKIYIPRNDELIYESVTLFIIILKSKNCHVFINLYFFCLAFSWLNFFKSCLSWKASCLSMKTKDKNLNQTKLN